MPGTKNIFRLLNKVNPDDPELTHGGLSDLEKMAAENTIARVLSKLAALQWVIAILAGVVGILATLVLASVGWLLAINWQTQRDIAALSARMETLAARVEMIAAQQSNPPPPPPAEHEDDDEDEREEQVRASSAN